MRKELDFAIRLSEEAGKMILGYFGHDLKVEQKGWADPVTAADRAAEAHIRAELAKSFPDDAIYGEEEGASAGATGRTWLIDPLDGTANFAGGLPTFAVCIALLGPDGQPQMNVTHDPIRGETFEAIRGEGARLNGMPIHVAPDAPLSGSLIHLAFPRDRDMWRCSIELTRRVTEVAPHARNIGSSALAQAYVACGRLHAHVRVSVGDFDIVGGNLLIEEAGGRVSDLGGGVFTGGDRGLLTAAPDVHDKLVQLKLLDVLDC